MQFEELEEFCKKLEVFPIAVVKMLKVIKKEAFTLEEVTEIISSELALSTKMLRIANSAFFGRSGPVNTINDAFMLLGANTAKNLALAFSIKKVLTIRDSIFDFDYFWRNSITAGIASELLARIVRYSKKNEYFLTGFLQDIGIIVLYNHDPETYKSILEEKKHTGEKLYLIEQETLSLNHQDAGSYLLKSWDFPESIYHPISMHHNPGDSHYVGDGTLLLLSTLDIADLVRNIYYGPDKSRKIAELYSKCSEKYSLRPEKIDYYINMAGKETMSMLSFFDLDPAGTKSYSEILKEENELLMQKLGMEIEETADKASDEGEYNEIDEEEELQDIRNRVLINERLREEVWKQDSGQ
jgi:HD-like signal output (HDOD) protein